MHKFLADVLTFHQTYGCTINETPTMPDRKVVQCRIDLILEEANELNEAFDQKDVVGIVDALVDLLYVVNGGIINFGYAKTMLNHVYDVHTWSFVKGHPRIPTAEPPRIEEGKIIPLENIQQNVRWLRDEYHGLTTSQTTDDKFVTRVYGLLTNLVGHIMYAIAYFGLRYVFEECHDEVQRSNMSKLGADGKPIFREDGKVLKGPNYFRPNLKPIIEKHAQQATN